MLDRVIAGGVLVDGSGSPRRHADVGIKYGRVVALGEIDEPSLEVVEVDGQIVAPGFVDIHTHYDAQIFWDPMLSPSPLHGVTTVIGGNCGFSVAPLREDGAEYLMKMLSRVEGIPLPTLKAAVSWDWTSTSEYFERLSGSLGVNVGFMVGHSAIRRAVMGENAVGHHATEIQICDMVRLLEEGLDAGGIGFSTSWGKSHIDGDGSPVPSRHASDEELVALAGVCGKYPGTSLEFVPMSGALSEHEVDLFTEMSCSARRALNWNLIRPRATSLERDRKSLAAGDHAALQGGRVVGLIMPVDFPSRYSFMTPFALDAFEGWGVPMAASPAERMRILQDKTERDRLGRLAAADPKRAELADWGQKRIDETFSPMTERYRGRLVAEIATEEHKSDFDALIDIVCVDKLKTCFSRVVPPDTAADWDARREIWRDPRGLIGGSDAGAHLDFAATFNYTTYLLATGVRDQSILTLEEAVNMLTAQPADLYGLRDRGRLVEGSNADIVVFDESVIKSDPVSMQYDLPGGIGRLFANATGISHVFVNGVEIVRDREFTNERPGKLLRGGMDTYTPHLVV